MCIYQMDTGMFNDYVSIPKQYIGYCTIPIILLRHHRGIMEKKCHWNFDVSKKFFYLQSRFLNTKSKVKNCLNP